MMQMGCGSKTDHHPNTLFVEISGCSPEGLGEGLEPGDQQRAMAPGVRDGL